MRVFTNVLYNQFTTGKTLDGTSIRVIKTSGRKSLDVQGKIKVFVGTILKRGHSIKTKRGEAKRGLVFYSQPDPIALGQEEELRCMLTKKSGDGISIHDGRSYRAAGIMAKDEAISRWFRRQDHPKIKVGRLQFLPRLANRIIEDIKDTNPSPEEHSEIQDLVVVQVEISELLTV